MRGVWHPLGPNLPAALEEYGRRVQPSPEGELNALLDAVFTRLKGRKVDPWAPNTVKQYTAALAKLKHLLRKFSRPEQVKQRDAAQVKVLLGPTPNWANRVISLARQIFGDLVEHQVIEANPFLGVKRHREAKRTRLITWEEWFKIRAVSPLRLQLVMDGLFLTDQRIDDVLGIDERDGLEAGVYFEQGKTGKELIVGWNPDLRAWWDACRALHGKVVKVAFDDPKRPRPLFRTRHGRRPAYRTVYDQWVLAVARAGVEDCNLHDNRAFSATEAKRQGLDPQALLGHDDARTTKIYLRDRMVEVVQGPTMRRTA
jgi:integrase